MSPCWFFMIAAFQTCCKPLHWPTFFPIQQTFSFNSETSNRVFKPFECSKSDFRTPFYRLYIRIHKMLNFKDSMSQKSLFRIESEWLVFTFAWAKKTYQMNWRWQEVAHLYIHISNGIKRTHTSITYETKLFQGPVKPRTKVCLRVYHRSIGC